MNANDYLETRNGRMVLILILCVSLFLLFGFYAEGQTTHTISLSKGYQMISSNIIPEDDSIHHIFAGKPVEIVIGKNGVYWQRGNVNTIHTWNSTQAYKVKANEPCTIEITGTPIELPSTIQMTTGYNYLPALRNIKLVDLVQGYEDNIIMIVDMLTLALWMPDMYTSPLENITVGKGYILLALSPFTLTF
jgi:hypothetical protein